MAALPVHKPDNAVAQSCCMGSPTLKPTFPILSMHDLFVAPGAIASSVWPTSIEAPDRPKDRTRTSDRHALLAKIGDRLVELAISTLIADGFIPSPCRVM